MSMFSGGMRRRLAVGVFLGFCITPRSPSTAQAPSDGSLTCTIQPWDNSYAVLELLPLVLTIELNNTGATPVIPYYSGLARDRSLTRMFPDPPHYRFIIESPDATTRSIYLADWVEWTVTSGGGTSYGELPPGHKQRIEYCLGRGLLRLYPMRDLDVQKHVDPVFPTPGKYKVRLALPLTKRQVLLSNTLAITVISARRPDDALALGFLKQSKWPDMLLSPLQGDCTGFPVLLSSPKDTSTTSPLVTCHQILERCPNSAYAPYARAFLGSALAMGWPDPWRGPRNTDDQGREGLRLLQEAAREPRLPLRFREQALVTIGMGCGILRSRASESAARQLPSLESVLGITREEAQREDKSYLYTLAYKMAKGQATPHQKDILAARYSKEQIAKLMAVANDNPLVPVAASLSPEQQELQRVSNWVKGELVKIPWRNEFGSISPKPIPIADP